MIKVDIMGLFSSFYGVDLITDFVESQLNEDWLVSSSYDLFTLYYVVVSSRVTYRKNKPASYHIISAEL